MKYLIMEDFAGQPVSFVFPRRVDHGDMREQLPYGRVLGAGYVELRDGAFRCHGGYAELDIVARPEDEAILMEAFQKAEACRWPDRASSEFPSRLFHWRTSGCAACFSPRDPRA
ncbi:MAG: hypothetical protein ACLU4B_04320 [Bilophila wadsworthia]